MATDNEESDELTEILQAVEAYNTKSNKESRLTRLTLLLAVGDDGPIALLAGPPVKGVSVDNTKVH